MRLNVYANQFPRTDRREDGGSSNGNDVTSMAIRRPEDGRILSLDRDREGHWSQRTTEELSP